MKAIVCDTILLTKWVFFINFSHKMKTRLAMDLERRLHIIISYGIARRSHHSHRSAFLARASSTTCNSILHVSSPICRIFCHFAIASHHKRGARHEKVNVCIGSNDHNRFSVDARGRLIVNYLFDVFGSFMEYRITIWISCHSLRSARSEAGFGGYRFAVDIWQLFAAQPGAALKQIRVSPRK